MQHFENKDNMDLKKLQEELELQYGPAAAQGIVDQVSRTRKSVKAPDYMDVKAMSELQERFRAQAMMAVWRLREWRKAQKRKLLQTNLIVLEGAFLQRQCEDAIKLYRQAHKSYFAMYREAMAAFSVRPSGNFTAARQSA